MMNLSRLLSARDNQTTKQSHDRATVDQIV